MQPTHNQGEKNKQTLCLIFSCNILNASAF